MDEEFKSDYVVDYFDEIEKRFDEQSKKRGKPTNEWKKDMNRLINECEYLRSKFLPKTDKTRVYANI